MTGKRWLVIMLGTVLSIGAVSCGDKTDSGDKAIVSVQPAGAGHHHTFKGTMEEAREFIKANREIVLTPDQEKIRVTALSELHAPCCRESSAATCCCECNLARAIWGLSKTLIVEGEKAAEVKRDVLAWMHALYPTGYTDDACMEGKCGSPLKEGGCGGMHENNLS